MDEKILVVLEVLKEDRTNVELDSLITVGKELVVLAKETKANAWLLEDEIDLEKQG